MNRTYDAEGLLVQLIILLPDGDRITACCDVYGPLGFLAFGSCLHLKGEATQHCCTILKAFNLNMPWVQ